MNKYLEKFLRQLKADNKSERTIETYEQNINKFFKHVGWDKVLTLTEEDVEEYKVYARTEDKVRNKKRQSESSVNLTLRSLKSFYKYLVKIKIIKNNLMKEIDDIKVPKRNHIYLTLEESEHFLNIVKAKNNCNKSRNILIFTMLLHCGLRLSELISIKVDQLNSSEAFFYIIGKGNKERPVILDSAVKEAYCNYMEYRKEHGYESVWLFLNKDGEKISTKQIQNLTKYYIELAKLNSKISPHKLRHSFATMNFENGLDIFTLQELLGHEQISTTRIYTHVTKKKLEEVANNNPLLKKSN